MTTENRKVVCVIKSHFAALHRLIEPLFSLLNFAGFKMSNSPKDQPIQRRVF